MSLAWRSATHPVARHPRLVANFQPSQRLWRNLVDAHGSGPCGLTAVEGRVLSAALPASEGVYDPSGGPRRSGGIEAARDGPAKRDKPRVFPGVLAQMRSQTCRSGQSFWGAEDLARFA